MGEITAKQQFVGNNEGIGTFACDIGCGFWNTSGNLALNIFVIENIFLINDDDGHDFHIKA